jgi:hypothetical protein
MWHIEGRREMRAGICWGKQKERGHLKELGIDKRIILKSPLKKWDMTWNGLI